MIQYVNKNSVEKILKELWQTDDGQKSEYRISYNKALQDVQIKLDTIEVKEVEEETESIWHDANQQPTMYRKYLVRYSDDRVSGSWERHDDGFIPWKDVVKEHGFTHWCYVEDLIKL